MKKSKDKKLKQANDIKGPSKYLNLKFDEIKERITAPGNRNNRVKYIDSIIVFLELLEMILWV